MPTDHDTVIADLKADVQAFCEARDWDQFHGAKDLSIAIATEAAELLELFRFATPEDVEEMLDQGRAEIQDELADVLIFVLRFGQRFAALDDHGVILEYQLPLSSRRPISLSTRASSARRQPGSADAASPTAGMCPS